VHLRDDGKGHCGFVIREIPGSGHILTVSGNTNAEGSREGDRVGMHEKPYAYFTGFFHVRPE
jgi:hypothetical protein